MTVYLNALGVICALGGDQATVSEGLFTGRSAIAPAADARLRSPWPVGAVDTALPSIDGPLAHQATRNNRMLLAAARQIEPQVREAIAQYGPARVAVVIGTSTSEIEQATREIQRHQQEGAFSSGYRYVNQCLAAPAEFLADHFRLAGPAYAISTACTSSGRALLSARRLLLQKRVDAVLCGGVDTLCQLTLHGFAALEALALQRCNPFSANRSGLNIGEGAALFLMTRQASPVALLGGGASSDAHHISAPDPQGRGALQAMHSALADARLSAEAIGYINLHGTATPHNDAMESVATRALFGAQTPCSSTKPLVGHTLGAAGALEAAFCWLTLERNPTDRLPPHLWDGVVDDQVPALHFATAECRLGPRRTMSNSFAFGGSNVSLILGEP